MSSRRLKDVQQQQPVGEIDLDQPKEDQELSLREAKKQVEIEAYLMKRALDKENLEEALKHAAKMLSELRTSDLIPKNYYDLYMQVHDHLRHLEMYFLEERGRGRRMQELYEVVQHAGNIVPRLYLMITVGSVYIRSKEAPAKDILMDLVEMCKGVQHPTRGLFLRHYLSQMTKDKLPDVGSEYEGKGGSVHDAIKYVLINFKETVNLFCRLKQVSLARDTTKREKERLELRILIGTNLVRLSQLEGVDVNIYKETVLPSVLEVITKCNDSIAQQYLMECVVQVFPDEFHIATLHTLLTACLSLQTEVDFKAILTSLMDRLANYSKRFPEAIPRGIDIIAIFTDYCAKICALDISTSDILSIQTSLMVLAMNTYPERLDYVSQILTNLTTVIKDPQALHEDVPARLAKRLLLIPVEFYKNILTVINLDNYAQLVSLLDFEDRKHIAVEIVRAALRYGQKVTEAADVSKLFELVVVLIKDAEDMPSDFYDDEFFEEEQHLVARMVHLLHNDSTDALFKMYSLVRKFFGQGGVKRILYTLPPLVFAYLKLAQRIRRIQMDEVGTELAIREDKVFQYIMEILEVLANQSSETALRLYLQSASCADSCNEENFTFEFMSQAMLLFEEEDSKLQPELHTLLVNTLQSLRNLSEGNYETLSTKTCQYSSKILLRKPDQCRAAFTCSHLFWPLEQGNEAMRNASKALECLQWSLKIVKACMSKEQLPLFVDILNVYMYQFHKGNEMITADYLNGLVELVNTNLSAAQAESGDAGDITSPAAGGAAAAASANTATFYKNSVRYLRLKKEQNAEQYGSVRV